MTEFKEFNLQDAPCTIKKTEQLRTVTQMRGGESITCAEMLLHLEIDLHGHEEGAEYLFPGLEEYVASVSELELFLGEDRNAKTKVPDVNLKLTYGEKRIEILDQADCPVKKKPKLRIGKKGKCTLEFKPMIKVDMQRLGVIAGYLGSDLRITIEATQVDIEAPPKAA